MKRLVAPGLIPELVCFVLSFGKTRHIFHWGRAVQPLWWSSLRNYLQAEPQNEGALSVGWFDRSSVLGSNA